MNAILLAIIISNRVNDSKGIFGNAKTAHNNNSSRFGKFIQVKYKENGMVQGAIVQKYLLEKSRIVSQGPLERNYHVFYYLLSGATPQERELLHLLLADKYCYLNAKNVQLENCDETYEFSCLKQSMKIVELSAEKQRRLFNVLSAVLLLGNVDFFPKKSTYHDDESVQVRNIDVGGLISELLKVKQDTLLAPLTLKRVKASGETLIMQYKLPEAIAARDALAKCLYGALFDWIVLQVNHALLNKDCLQLFESKPTGLLWILDDFCNFPGATNEALLQKFNSVHRDNKFYEKPQKKKKAFIIQHYAGRVKYQVTEMREKNLDLMRQDIVSVLENSSMALVGADPVAVFRWAILHEFLRGYFAFGSAGMKHRKDRNSQSMNKTNRISRFRSPNESILSQGHKMNIVSFGRITRAKYHSLLQSFPKNDVDRIVFGTAIPVRRISRLLSQVFHQIKHPISMPRLRTQNTSQLLNAHHSNRKASIETELRLTKTENQKLSEFSLVENN